MKFKTGLVSLLVVCGACSQATKEADVVKDSFDFAGQQLKYAFTQIDSAKSKYAGGTAEKEAGFSPHDRR